MNTLQMLNNGDKDRNKDKKENCMKKGGRKATQHTIHRVLRVSLINLCLF